MKYKLKNGFLSLSFLLWNIGIAQESFYKKLLFDKAIDVKTLPIVSEYETKSNIHKLLFDHNDFKKCASYNTLDQSEIHVIKRKTGSVIEYESADEESYLKAKKRIQDFKVRNYNNFSEKLEYKEYHIYNFTGKIIAFNNEKKQMLLILVNSCVFEDQKRRIVQLLEKRKIFDIYVFNCGGKELVTKR
ncbi:hypothetical protein [Flavobacterium gelatinilyticum]|uniref:hypothetical protein n=1 Tax=Flavobacterium gelatinilyticum TaxID=3003260 RepID=UPI002480F8E0|nr:hypothetical protein [Flavobacterium gelatinilyticum]